MPIDKQQAMNALRTVLDPELGKDLVTLNMIKDVQVQGASVRVVVELTTPACPLKATIQRDVEQALRDAGAEQVRVEFGARPGSGAGGAGQPVRQDVLPQVKYVIAVGAGKGGVGKSTVAVNLALALQHTGARVGLMDGDIYGPSMPTMLGIKGMMPQVHGNKVVPLFVHKLHAMTIGLLVEDDKPLIWRGPMAHGAFKQLLADNTEWPELDYMVVDLPPGTGDVPLTLCQLLPLAGAIVVATPQQVALDDAVRAVRMFQTLNTPVLGLVENMSYFIAPDGGEHDIFGRGGTERAAQELGLPYLGAIPMLTELRVNSDSGNPEANFAGHPKLRAALEEIAKNVAEQVKLRAAGAATPELTVT